MIKKYETVWNPVWYSQPSKLVAVRICWQKPISPLLRFTIQKTVYLHMSNFFLFTFVSFHLVLFQLRFGDTILVKVTLKKYLNQLGRSTLYNKILNQQWKVCATQTRSNLTKSLKYPWQAINLKLHWDEKTGN